MANTLHIYGKHPTHIWQTPYTYMANTLHIYGKHPTHIWYAPNTYMVNTLHIYGMYTTHVPQNMEKYLSPTVGHLKFIDSFQSTPKDLDVLAKTLADDEFRYLRESCTSNHFCLIPRKGVYPYDYIGSFGRFDETKLLSQDAFFSKLFGRPCSDSEKTHATRVWTAFGCRTMADYHDIYLQLDVFLLADLFKEFRTTCLE